VKQIIDAVQSIVMFGLVAMGVVGLVWRTVKEDGWLGTLVDKLINAIVDSPVITFTLLVALGLFGKLWHDHQVEKGFVSRLPNFFLYIVMAAGAYFVWHFLSTGTL
jgi:hypothetical protein